MLTFEQIKNYLDKNAGEKTIVAINGGEPTIHPDFIKIVDYAAKLGAEVSVLTNGRQFCDNEFALSAVKAGLKDICMPLHGPNEEIHDMVTGAKGSFRETITGLKNLFRLKAEGNMVGITLKLLINKLNIKYLPETMSFVNKELIRPNTVLIEAIDIVCKALDNKERILLKLAEAAPYVAEAVRRGLSANQRVIIKDIPPCIFPNPEFYYSLLYPCINETQKIYGPMRQDENSNLSNTSVKPLTCRECEIDQSCGGVWRSYEEVIGLSEFKPIKRLKLPLCLR
jgi:MoaA/NifB/PqqE/SkfB family radical SAM enzyme